MFVCVFCLFCLLGEGFSLLLKLSTCVNKLICRANPNVTQNFHIVSEREKHQKVKDLVSDLHKYVFDSLF